MTITRIKKTYKCDWCGHEFEAEAQYSDSGKGISNQIVCPNCLRNIPTWKRINGAKIRR